MYNYVLLEFQGTAKIASFCGLIFYLIFMQKYIQK